MRIFPLLIALVMVFSSGAAGWASTVAPASSASSATPESGLLTEVKGNVYTRGFKDKERQIWSCPSPAHQGDIVSDGMQVGTGDDSWTQCKFKHVTARAWENSVYMVSPKQKLVYLVGGELLFNLDKHRPDHSAYSIWTKYLHATVRGTTLLVQSTPEGSRVSVLEGTVDVTNRLDQSVVTLTPGSVYEVKAKDSDKHISSLPDDDGVADSAFISMDRTAQEDATLNATLKSFAGKVDLTTGSLIDISVPSIDPVVLFDSLVTTTLGAHTSLQQILSHPLLTAFESPLASLPLIQEEMPVLKSGLQLTQAQNVTSLFKCLEVKQVPLFNQYNIGLDTLQKLKDRQVAIQHWAPMGVVSWSHDKVDGTQSVLQQEAGRVGSLSLTGNRADISSLLGARGSIVPASLSSVASGMSAGFRSAGNVSISAVTAGSSNAVRGVAGGLTGGSPGGSPGGGGLGGALGGILNGGGLGGLLK